MTDEQLHRSSPERDRYVAEFGARLMATQPSAQPSRGRTLRARWRAAAVSVAATAAALGLVLSVGGESGDRVDFVAKAEAALAPPAQGEVLHLKVTSTTGKTGKLLVATTEVWAASSPARWRLLQYAPAPGTPASDIPQGDDGHAIHGPLEFDSKPGQQRQYDVDGNVLDVSVLPSTQNAPAAPGFNGLTGTDPAAQIAQASAAGRLSDRGVVTVDGRKVRRFIASSRTALGIQRFVYDVDPATYAPVDGVMTVSSDPGMTTRFHVDAFDRLPLNATTLKLTRVQPRAGATVHTTQVRPTARRR